MRLLPLRLLLLISKAAAATLTGRAEIVDGDTIKVGSIPVRPLAGPGAFPGPCTFGQPWAKSEALSL